MLQKLKKMVSKAATAVQQEELNVVDTQQAATELSVDMAAQLEVANKTLAEQIAAFAELNSKLEAAQAELATVAAAKAAVEASAKEAKMAARKEQLAATLGDDKALALLAATDGVDDAVFSAIATAMTGKLEVEAASSMFVEQGATGDIDPALVVIDPVQKLAATLAAKFKTDAQ